MVSGLGLDVWPLSSISHAVDDGLESSSFCEVDRVSVVSDVFRDIAKAPPVKCKASSVPFRPTSKPLRMGRRVARQPAIMPRLGSAIDQMATSLPWSLVMDKVT